MIVGSFIIIWRYDSRKFYYNLAIW